ncbi:TPA: glycosyltransferase family A protein [Providencia stuartii]
MSTKNNIYKPAIVVVAYNRPNSLQRLLYSLSIADYCGYNNIDLIISVDYSTSNQNVIDLANNFKWKFGKKSVIVREKNLGLKKHVLCCGDLSSIYGSIIMLEDDLAVSPNFYNYAALCLNYYGDDAQISGISLYKHILNVHAQLRFEPLITSSSNFFMQFPCSWGQAWTDKQWMSFKNWISQPFNLTKDIDIPSTVLSWSDKSWLKLFCAYMISENKFFVYPYISYSTNFNDSGSHVKYSNSNFQVNLSLIESRENSNFISFEKCNSVYDAYFEILDCRLKRLCPHLEKYNFCVDLYGMKNIEKCDSDLVLTTNDIIKNKEIFSIERNLWPHELNLIIKDINNSKGEIKLVDKRYILKRKATTLYFTPYLSILSIRHLIKNKIYKYLGISK